MKCLPRYRVEPYTDAVWAVADDVFSLLHEVATQRRYTMFKLNILRARLTRMHPIVVRVRAIRFARALERSRNT